jgi:uncharacterized membrane protein YeaQ/YmgE (transglycosylase-associated protein family)
MLFAILVLHPSHVAGWVGVGLIAGWLVGKATENASYGIVGDLILGSLGAVVGGASARFYIGRSEGFWIPVLVALIGACIFVAVARVLVAWMSP